MAARVLLVALFYFFCATSYGFANLEEAAGNPQNTINYKALISEYSALLADGKQSFELYFNLGVAYGEMGDFGKSRLYFEKAKKLKPTNQDLNKNLDLLQKKVAQPEIVPIPTFFLTKITQYTAGFLSLDSWFVLVFGCFSLLCALVYFNLYTKRKVPTYAWILTVSCLIVSLSFFGVRQQQMQDASSGVVMTKSEVKSSPESVTDSFLTINLGQKVTILTELGDWYQVRLANGLEGYIASGQVERI